MKTHSIAVAFALVAVFAAPQARADAKTVSDAVRILSGKNAAFTQRFLPRGYKKEQVETGSVVFGVPPASRWSYVTPEKKTFVFDGTTSWMFVPADQTVMVHRVTPEEKNRLPFFVLADPDKLNEWYAIETRGTRTMLTANDAGALLQTIEVELDASGRMKILKYTDAQGNRTTFELTKWTTANAADNTFTFTPPPGVDVIQN